MAVGLKEPSPDHTTTNRQAQYCTEDAVCQGVGMGIVVDPQLQHFLLPVV